MHVIVVQIIQITINAREAYSPSEYSLSQSLSEKYQAQPTMYQMNSNSEKNRLIGRKHVVMFLSSALADFL